MKRGVGILVAVGAWGLAFGPTLAWLARAFVQSDARLNLVLLAVFCGAALWRRRRALRAEPAGRAALAGGRDDSAPALPLALLAGGCAAFVAAHALIGFHSVDAACAGAATYGALGLVLSPAAFRRGSPAALLVALVLPMGGHMDTMLGFPLRLATADLVGGALHWGGLAPVARSTVVVLENAAAHVDLPCSGIRSLWSGLLFYLVATLALEARLGARWLAGLAATAGALLAFNAARVLALSVAVLVLKAPLLARVIHAPLGILGFCAACALGLLFLRPAAAIAEGAARSPLAAARGRIPAGVRSPLAAARGSIPAGAFLLAAACAQVFSRPEPAPTLLRAALSPPAALAATPVPFTAAERDFLALNGADYRGKWRFAWRGAAGSFLVVAARSWRAHHPPEQCLAGAGLDLANIGTRLVAPDFPVRVVDVAGEGSRASYWFQAKGTITDDHAARVWDGLRRDREWLMISILLDRPLADAAAWTDLHLALAAAGDRLLDGLEPAPPSRTNLSLGTNPWKD